MTNCVQLDFIEQKTPEIILGDCLDEMRKMNDNSIDFIVTDPPYGLHFMGKTWDKFKKSNFNENENHKQLKSSYISGDRDRQVRSIYSANANSGTYDPKRDDEFQEFMRIVGIEMLRILKPGGHIAMFGSPRRHHRQMSGLEDAGFEIRDVIMWIFGQGFPKSHNHFGLEGYGTALKPAYEPIIIAMKPLDGTYAQNAEKWGVAGININASRIEGIPWKEHEATGLAKNKFFTDGKCSIINKQPHEMGRWPANIILDEESAEMLDQKTSHLKTGHRNRENHKQSTSFWDSQSRSKFNDYEDSGGASRFFYCAKASPSERNKGLEGFPLKSYGRETKRQNNHPTVKPISLMKYIIKLLAPPGNPVCLDPFAGSGTTLIAAKELGINAIGIEKELEYFEIAKARIA